MEIFRNGIIIILPPNLSFEGFPLALGIEIPWEIFREDYRHVGSVLFFKWFWRPSFESAFLGENFLMYLRFDFLMSSKSPFLGF